MAFCRLTYVSSTFALKQQPCSCGSRTTQGSVLLQLHSGVQGAGCMLLQLRADLALWRAVSVCSLPGSVRPGTELL